MKLACFWLLVSASRSGQCQAWHGALLLRPSGRTSERMFERGYGSPEQESNVSRQFTPFCFATPFSSHVLSARLLRCRAIRRTAVFLNRGEEHMMKTRFALARPLRSLLAAALLPTTLTIAPLAIAGDKVVLLTSWYAQAEQGGFYQALADGLYEKEGWMCPSAWVDHRSMACNCWSASKLISSSTMTCRF